MFLCRIAFAVALFKASFVEVQGVVGNPPNVPDAGTTGEPLLDLPIYEMDTCACETPPRTVEERLCSPDINFLTHLKLVGNGNPRCHNPINKAPTDEQCMAVVYTFESTKVGGVTIDISTPKDVPGCQIVPQPGVKYAISGKQFQKDIVVCNEISAADVVLIVDESGSIGNNIYQNLVKPFLINLKDALTPPGISLVNFGAVTFDTTAEVRFELEAGRTSAEISSLINNLPFGGGFTAIGDALALAANNILVDPFATDSNPNICIVLSDGNSNRGISVASGAAQLKTKCECIFAIGVGNGIDQITLDTIASDPDKAIRVSDFSELTDALVETIKQNICTPTGETKKVCNTKHCLGIFAETDHNEFQSLKQIYDTCPSL